MHPTPSPCLVSKNGDGYAVCPRAHAGHPPPALHPRSPTPPSSSAWANVFFLRSLPTCCISVTLSPIPRHTQPPSPPSSHLCAAQVTGFRVLWTPPSAPRPPPMQVRVLHQLPGGVAQGPHHWGRLQLCPVPGLAQGQHTRRRGLCRIPPSTGIEQKVPQHMEWWPSDCP